MNRRINYPAKIMLVGEYGVILGGSALTIPLHCFRATIRSREDIPADKKEDAQQSVRYLEKLYGYISALPENSFHARPDLELFSGGMDKFWMEMNIPTGYGLGSSGAVSAGIYDLFFPGADRLELMQKKEDLARIESFFHGTSSGVDALTIHSDTSLYFIENKEIKKVDFNPSVIPGNYRFFLLDSGKRFETGPLVKHFLTSMEDEDYAGYIRNEYMDINQKLIEALLGTRDADPAMLVGVLSDFQFRHFRNMIPESVLDLWIEGQVTNEYYLKLNGSGGGFMLGIAHESSMESLDSKWEDRIIWIE